MSFSEPIHDRKVTGDRFSLPSLRPRRPSPRLGETAAGRAFTRGRQACFSKPTHDRKVTGDRCSL
ncbi:MAG: hypothetical protein ACE5IM_06795, partial [Nitrospinota bacterium]